MRWVTLLILFLVTVGYLAIGAAVFQALESQNEQDLKQNSGDFLQKFLERAECVNREDLERLILGVLKAYDQGVIALNQTTSSENWNFASSFFFSATVVTTIGYGHISPSTHGGRWFCIVYAVIGIPIIAVFLAGVGQKIHSPLKKFKDRQSWKKHPKVEKVLKSIFVHLIGFCLLLLLPAIGFHRNEGWTFFEAFYYSVISLTTIGFGDFVAGQEEERLRPLYQVGIIVWIFVGLSLVSAVLTDVGDYYTEKVTKTEDKWKKRRESKEAKKEREANSASLKYSERL